ncbi:MAG: helix-turn-helix domain-containing protein [Muribaculaceae bacterium]|nr:helix-turn-helix domain-containing protein [Muribaculaceae bacterium]
MEINNLNRSKLAAHLGVSKGYVSQLLNGDYDHKLSKLIELAIAFGYVPEITFRPIEEVITEDVKEYRFPEQEQGIEYVGGFTNSVRDLSIRDFEGMHDEKASKVA